MYSLSHELLALEVFQHSSIRCIPTRSQVPLAELQVRRRTVRGSHTQGLRSPRFMHARSQKRSALKVSSHKVYMPSEGLPSRSFWCHTCSHAHRTSTIRFIQKSRHRSRGHTAVAPSCCCHISAKSSQKVTANMRSFHAWKIDAQNIYIYIYINTHIHTVAHTLRKHFSGAKGTQAF